MNQSFENAFGEKDRSSSRKRSSFSAIYRYCTQYYSRKKERNTWYGILSLVQRYFSFHLETRRLPLQQFHKTFVTIGHHLTQSTLRSSTRCLVDFKKLQPSLRTSSNSIWDSNKAADKLKKMLGRERGHKRAIYFTEVRFSTYWRKPVHKTISRTKAIFPILKWLCVSMTYHQFPNLHESFQGDLNTKINKGFKLLSFHPPVTVTAKANVHTTSPNADIGLLYYPENR